MNFFLIIKQRFVRWLLKDISLENLKIGQNTITIGPSGVGDVIRWSATKVAQAVGDIGMNVTTGRISAFVGGAAKDLALSSEAISLLGFGALIGVATNSMVRWGNGASAALSTDSLDARIEITAPGILKNLRVAVAVAPGLGNSNVYTVRINGSDTSITTTISGASATTGQDVINTISVVAGDLVEIKVAVGSGVPVNVASRAELQVNWI